jgi:D-glycero-D-manno-heptose 1,7-bisphosphate phosphatase
MVGDRCSDIGAANAAGLRQMFLIAGTEEKGRCGGNFIEVTGLGEVEAWLVEQG